MTTDIQLSWAAGFIDGEGTISAYHVSKGRVRPREFLVWISAVNTDPRPLRILQTMFGGSIVRTRIRKGWKDLFHWKLSHRAAANAISAIAPYLVCKREQADLALETYVLLSVGRGKRRPAANVEAVKNNIVK